MGIPELDLMFDVLDTGLTGYLTTSQLSEFFQDVYFLRLDRNQLEGALQTVCGYNHDNRCSREHFLPILQELERRKSLEEKIYWDFRALDFEGNNRISIESTLFLFKAVHEEKFSLKTWNNFVKHRFDPTSDVSFDEVKIFLCNLPVGGPCDDGEYFNERDEVSRKHADEEYSIVKELRDLQVRLISFNTSYVSIFSIKHFSRKGYSLAIAELLELEMTIFGIRFSLPKRIVGIKVESGIPCTNHKIVLPCMRGKQYHAVLYHNRRF